MVNLHLHLDYKPLIYPIQVNPKGDLAIYSTNCSEASQIKWVKYTSTFENNSYNSNISTIPIKTNQEKVANVIDYPLPCIENPHLYVIPTICRFVELSRISIFVMKSSVGYQYLW